MPIHSLQMTSAAGPLPAQLAVVATFLKRPIGDLLLRVMAAMNAGTWQRFKLCANPECARAFYDSSRNRSARWCSMATCGNRMKGRAYRRRHAHEGQDQRSSSDDRIAVAS